MIVIVHVNYTFTIITHVCSVSSLPDSLNPNISHRGSSGSLESNHSTGSTATLESDKDNLKGSLGSAHNR